MLAGHMVLPATDSVVTFVRTERTKYACAVVDPSEVSSTSRQVAHVRFGATIWVGADVEASPFQGLGVRPFAGDAIGQACVV